mmetsp:Transcript_65677/g.76382  ORF Transcript_65677/g.76382 Transcript_65677/m.76382 type:complete len:98 (-) Transcript_65677:86-379(-)
MTPFIAVSHFAGSECYLTSSNYSTDSDPVGNSSVFGTRDYGETNDALNDLGGSDFGDDDGEVVSRRAVLAAVTLTDQHYDDYFGGLCASSSQHSATE